MTAHKFFDTLNIALIGAESAALIADGIYTQRALTRYPEFFREDDPLARPFVMNGWSGQIAGGILVVSADVGLLLVASQEAPSPGTAGAAGADRLRHRRRHSWRPGAPTRRAGTVAPPA